VLTIRHGIASDLPALIAMADDAVAWLTSTGRGGQWGTTPWSQNEHSLDRLTEMAAGDGLWVGELDHRPVGVMALGEPPPYVPTTTEPELYVQFLLASPRHRGQGIGRSLLEHADAEARRQGINLLRVDCWAAGDGRLIEYYVAAGFRPTERLQVGSWPGQLLERRQPTTS
jgi:GNAT superfamily N-acetyltransferase